MVDDPSLRYAYKRIALISAYARPMDELPFKAKLTTTAGYEFATPSLKDYRIHIRQHPVDLII